MAVTTPHTLSSGLTVNVFLFLLLVSNRFLSNYSFTFAHISFPSFSLCTCLYSSHLPLSFILYFIMCACVCVCCFCSYQRLTLLLVACLCVVDTALPSTTSYLCSRPTTGPPSVSVFPTSTLNSSSLSTTSWSGTVQ